MTFMMLDWRSSHAVTQSHHSSNWGRQTIH